MFSINQFYNLYFSWRVKYKKIISFNIYSFNFFSIFNQIMLTPNWIAQFKLNQQIEQVFKILLNYNTLIFNHAANENSSKGTNAPFGHYLALLVYIYYKKIFYIG